MPLLLGKIMPAGLLGLLVAGLLAAFMSTHDSYLLAWSAVISQDIIGPLTPRGKLADRQSILVTRVSIVAIGVFLLIWGVWYELPESVWTYMAVTGTVYLSGAATALIGGMYWPAASSTGALMCLLGGLTALPVLFIDKLQRLAAGVSLDLKTDQLNEIQTAAITDVEVWLNKPTVALAVYGICVVLFVAGSLLFPDRHDVSAIEVTL
jgi:SSS family solute:Na+ symporter